MRTSNYALMDMDMDMDNLLFGGKWKMIVDGLDEDV